MDEGPRHRTCQCGHWLLEWGRAPQRVWCAGVTEGLTYQRGRATYHDVYGAEGQLLMAGACRMETAAPLGAYVSTDAHPRAPI